MAANGSPGAAKCNAYDCLILDSIYCAFSVCIVTQSPADFDPYERTLKHFHVLYCPDF